MSQPKENVRRGRNEEMGTRQRSEEFLDLLQDHGIVDLLTPQMRLELISGRIPLAQVLR